MQAATVVMDSKAFLELCAPTSTSRSYSLATSPGSYPGGLSLILRTEYARLDLFSFSYLRHSCIFILYQQVLNLGDLTKV